MAHEVKPPPSVAFNRVGWAIGFLFSVILPKLTSPLGLSAPFDIGGTISGMFGFAAMTGLMKQTNKPLRLKFRTAVAALVLGLAAGYWYRHLLLSPEHGTPSAGIEAWEFILFCFSYLCICAVLAYAYWRGGPEMFRMFGKIPTGGT